MTAKSNNADRRLATKAPRTPEEKERRRLARREKAKEQLPLHIILLPGVIATLIFSYVPMYGVLMAFQNYSPKKGIFGSKWVGLKHFERLLQLPDFYDLLRNTLIIAIVKIATLLFFALVLALLLNEVRRKKLRSGIQACMIFPHFLSWIILGGLLRTVLDKEGFFNDVLVSLGMEPIYFLGNDTWFIIVLVISNLWQEAGFSAILYTAAIAGVNQNLYEAAEIDGANRWQQVWHITLKSIKPFVILMIVLNIGNILNAGFDQIFNLYNGLVLDVADVIDTYVYRVGLYSGQFSFGTAVGLFKSVIAVILIGISYYLADKFAKYRIF